MADRQVVVFALGAQTYGVSIRQVKSIERLTDISQVPNTVPFIRGVTNIRGDIVPVVDMRHRVGLTSSAGANPDDERLILVSIQENLVGLIVDSVHDVHTVDDENIEVAPALVGGLEAQYLDGIVKRDDGLFILLNLEKILSQAEERQLEEVERSIRG